ncbi:MAG: spondin domain-containing protein [Acidobacteria bacterium]|nr:spondin domain-containing protein [Acidobacteriota bacterium]
MLKTQFRRIALTATTLVAALSLATAAQAAGGQRYTVSITNLTKGQIISPAVVASHSEDAEPLFIPGRPASAELAKVAEDAMLDDLIYKLSHSADVLDVKTILGAGGPIMPGETASVEVEGLGHHRFISLVAMLVSTNDAFVGIRNVEAPANGTVVRMPPAYDAGSEVNTELCTDIPGPPCEMPGVRVTEGAEGYVYVHPGISGIGDLDPSVRDWRNPVARISIQRAK